MKNQTLRSIGCGIAAVFCLAMMAQAENPANGPAARDGLVGEDTPALPASQVVGGPWQVAFQEKRGATATGVKAVRFRILLPSGTPPQGFSQDQPPPLIGTAFREIDVFGAPTTAGTASERK
jgi:hypothetical protein